MNSAPAFALLFLFCITFILSAQAQYDDSDGYTYAVTNLNRFQTTTGGYKSRERDVAPTLDATVHALFLSSLFGLKQRDPAAVVAYLHQLENGDYGYGKSAGLASDLESVRYAVLSYRLLGQSIPNVSNVAKFVSSLYNEKTGLFASRAGAEGDIKSTALAFQILDYLEQLKRPFAVEAAAKAKTYLQAHKTAKGESTYFSVPEDKTGLTALGVNYYGILIGSYVGFDFTPADRWANYILSQQAETGVFGNLESTYHALQSLHILPGHHVDRMPAGTADKLFNNLKSLPRDLHIVSTAHACVAVTKFFNKNFMPLISYEVLRSSGPVTDKKVIQGAQLKPVVAIRTFDYFNHPGLDVEVTITFDSASGKRPTTTKLQWRDSEQGYTSDDFVDTENQLGSITFKYTIRVYVVGTGELNFDLTDVKTIGYGVQIVPEARLEVTGRSFRPGEAVAIGTNFKFALALSNHTTPNLLSGDFDVAFSVLDSSRVPIYASVINAKRNTGPLGFNYSLTSSNIPSGDIAFRFDVSSSTGIHTTEFVDYVLSIPMIASKITFENNTRSYKIGDDMKVTIEPASFPDLRTRFTYDSKDFLGGDAISKRHFFMDVHSAGGALIRTIPGVPQSGSVSRYAFESAVEPTLDSIGNNIISFRYITERGQNIQLANFDSATEEIYEDAAELNYTVAAKLQVADLTGKPTDADYFYGNVISFKFRVLDTVSGNYLRQRTDSTNAANVYLSLEHKDSRRGKAYVSALQPATQATGETLYSIEWPINPNAVKGSGSLSVSVQNADGAEIELLENNKPVRYDVKIGGDIEVNENIYTTSHLESEESAFIVDFQLTCKGKSLKGAQLRASLLSEGGKVLISSIPVSTNAAGAYSVSTTLLQAQAPSGTYQIKFFREVDRKYALEDREQLIKQRLRDEELNGVKSDASAALPDIESELEPLFTISLRHDSPASGKLPIRTEVIVVFLLGVAFFYLSYQKKHYTALAKN